MKPVATIAVTIFALVALTHLCRIAMGWEVVIAGVVIPMWASYLGLLLAGSVALLLWRESRLGKG